MILYLFWHKNCWIQIFIEKVIHDLSIYISGIFGKEISFIIENFTFLYFTNHVHKSTIPLRGKFYDLIGI